MAHPPLKRTLAVSVRLTIAEAAQVKTARTIARKRGGQWVRETVARECQATPPRPWAVPVWPDLDGQTIDQLTAWCAQLNDATRRTHAQGAPHPSVWPMLEQAKAVTAVIAQFQRPPKITTPAVEQVTRDQLINVRISEEEAEQWHQWCQQDGQGTALGPWARRVILWALGTPLPAPPVHIPDGIIAARTQLGGAANNLAQLRRIALAAGTRKFTASVNTAHEEVYAALHQIRP